MNFARQGFQKLSSERQALPKWYIMPLGGWSTRSPYEAANAMISWRPTPILCGNVRGLC